MIFSEKGERAMTAQGHSEMADAYEEAAADPRLTPEKRQEYQGKAMLARKLADKAKGHEIAWLQRLTRKTWGPI
jgi:hypothetical protein